MGSCYHFNWPNCSYTLATRFLGSLWLMNCSNTMASAFGRWSLDNFGVQITWSKSIPWRRYWHLVHCHYSNFMAWEFMGVFTNLTLLLDPFWAGSWITPANVPKVLVDTGPAILISALTNICADAVGAFTGSPEITLLCVGNLTAMAVDFLYRDVLRRKFLIVDLWSLIPYPHRLWWHWSDGLNWRTRSSKKLLKGLENRKRPSMGRGQTRRTGYERYES